MNSILHRNIHQVPEPQKLHARTLTKWSKRRTEGLNGNASACRGRLACLSFAMKPAWSCTRKSRVFDNWQSKHPKMLLLPSCPPECVSTNSGCYACALHILYKWHANSLDQSSTHCPVGMGLQAQDSQTLQFLSHILLLQLVGHLWCPSTAPGACAWVRHWRKYALVIQRIRQNRHWT
jgi:hypothetical protein